ncbi:type II toxin-antitoxin system VapC family toxin [Calothrix sp. CCY 0018]|uniref:type II toxin-antitoxin system VapC family toxin n=1 Tax=Calothrix sp. CCY 0018 TaxID=3103864 RepID=UPI0039C6CA39
MNRRFLLDTNIISEPLRPIPNSNVMEKLRQYEDEIVITTIVYHELLFGCYRLPESKKRQTIERYIQEVIEPHIPFISYDVNAAKWHATERARLMKTGKTPSFADSQIAAIAKVNNLILVTNNVSDFVNFSELKIENWFDIK